MTWRLRLIFNSRLHLFHRDVQTSFAGQKSWITWYFDGQQAFFGQPWCHWAEIYVIRKKDAPMVITWPLQAVFLWALFSSDCQLLTTKLDFDFIRFISTEVQLNHKVFVLVFLVFFHSFDSRDYQFSSIFTRCWRHWCRIDPFWHLDNFLELAIFKSVFILWSMQAM